MAADRAEQVCIHSRGRTFQAQEASTTESSDAFGNECTFFSLFRPHDALEVKALSTVCLTDRYADFDPDVGFVQ